MHEFRALCLFALKRYDEAAAVAYTVLTAGPGWNWTTLVGLYPDVDTYTNQLRALEAYVESNPSSSSAQFLLAYQYLAQGNTEAAATMFERVVQLQPNDELSASFVKLYKKARRRAGCRGRWPHAQPGLPPPRAPANRRPSPPTSRLHDAPAPAAAAEAQSKSSHRRPRLLPISSALWKSQASPDVSIALTLQQDGQFAWEVDTKGTEADDQRSGRLRQRHARPLAARRAPLIGKVTQDGDSKFVFAPPAPATRRRADIHPLRHRQR